jgi:hypothetical protein
MNCFTEPETPAAARARPPLHHRPPGHLVVLDVGTSSAFPSRHQATQGEQPPLLHLPCMPLPLWIGRKRGRKRDRKHKVSSFAVSRWLLPTKIPGESDHLRSISLYRWMHNITSYLLVFESPKTVQYRRRLHLPKFGPETDSRFQFSSLFRLSVFRRASPSRLCSVFHQSCLVRILAYPSCSTSFVSLKSVPIIVAAEALNSVHFAVYRKSQVSSFSSKCSNIQLTAPHILPRGKSVSYQILHSSTLALLLDSDRLVSGSIHCGRSLNHPFLSSARWRLRGSGTPLSSAFPLPLFFRKCVISCLIHIF